MSDNWHFNREEQFRKKRDMLLRVAAECFNHKGFSGTSLKDVARQLDITDAAIYYYVKNKEELVHLCYIRAVELAAQALDNAIAEGKTIREKLELYIRNQIKVLCDQDIGPVAILSEVPSLKPQHKEIILEHSRLHSKRLAALIEEGIEKGEFKPCNPRLVVAAIMGGVNWMPKWYRPNIDHSIEEISDSFVQTYCTGLLPRN